MNRTKLHHTLRDLAAKGRWCVSEATLQRLTGAKLNTIRVSLSRHVRQGHLDRLAPGLYLNAYAKLPSTAVERVAAYLRPDDFFYVSLESALHEHGLISQIPNRLTLMTTGRSHTYTLPLGVIEFVHTKRPLAAWRGRVSLDLRRQIHVASADLALEDLRHVKRNLDLVELEN